MHLLLALRLHQALVELGRVALLGVCGVALAGCEDVGTVIRVRILTMALYMMMAFNVSSILSRHLRKWLHSRPCLLSFESWGVSELMLDLTA